MYKVLLVDDEPWTLIGLKKTIPWYEYQMEIIKETTDPREAMNFILDHEPDVVVTDIRMPGMSGLEIMEAISEKGLNPLVVVISGFSEFAYAQKAIREGAFDYLLKPIEEEKGRDLAARLEKSLEKRTSRFTEEPLIENRQFRELVEYLRMNFREAGTLKEHAGQFGLNPSYCSQLFKKYYDTSYSGFLTSLRIEKAKILLMNETLSVEDVAERCGFNDYYYFNKVFKKQLDITPAKYRKSR